MEIAVFLRRRVCCPNYRILRVLNALLLGGPPGPVTPAHKKCVMMNAIWALSPFTAANGATRVIPGSHKWDKDRLPDPDDVRRAEMDPGDVLIFLGSTLHGGGANTSGENRTGAVISYNLGWLRQTENFYLSIPWEVAAQMPEKLQRLLGYQSTYPMSAGWKGATRSNG